MAYILLMIPAGRAQTSWEFEMTQVAVDHIEVSLIAGDEGADRIALNVAADREHLLVLTPAQARLLANELITAVNRAEVKASLKSTPNLWRRSGNLPARPVETSGFQGDDLPRLARAR